MQIPAEQQSCLQCSAFEFKNDYLVVSLKHNQPSCQGWGWSKIHVKFHASQQGFSNVASDWLTAVLPANQMPGKIR